MNQAATTPCRRCGPHGKHAWAWRTALAGAACAAAFEAAVRWAPFPTDTLTRATPSAVLTDRGGEPLRVRLAVGGLDRRPGYAPAAEHWIVKAIVAAEDRRFWSHPGVDGLAIGRAAAQNLFSGRRLSGASTISTQVIRMIEPRPRTLRTKLIEAFRALQMERRLGKREILAHYLDLAPFGGNIVGIEAAARRYFHKRADELCLAEAALLAGLPQSPSRLRPDRHPERAKERQAWVLERMQARGMITARQRAEALAQPIQVRPGSYPFSAPHFCDLVGVPARPACGSVVRTTLDADLQRLAEGSLRRCLQGGPVDCGAVVVIEVGTGAVRALVGSPDYARPRAGQVNGAVAPRAAGSTLKPFAYALALDRGLVTPATVLADVPARFRDFDPRNFSLDFLGRVSVRDALVLSLNLPAIDIEQRVGQERFHAILRDVGLFSISKPASHYGLGLVLGNAEVRLLDLANAYACLARGGGWAPPRFVESPNPPATRQVFSPEACWLISEMLGGEERAMDATGHTADVRLPPMAWKTGTSTGLRDAWTVAWNPEVVIAVWAGNSDGSASELLVGRRIATPIAWDLLRRLYPDNRGPWFARPAGIVTRAVCAESGCPPGPHCGCRSEDWAIANVSRHEFCPVHREGAKAAWPPSVAAFLNRGAAPAAAESAGSLRILSPARGCTYRHVLDLDVDAQRLALDAATDRAGDPLHWFVDDRPVGRSRVGQPLFWPIERGKHRIVCSTLGGASECVQITVE
ncbi:MAG TPA: penicillin-binding protein 1C [Verrucomicrobiota bacterium]|nr:penicillin-binding protein 1C [Verrucomicrobiota bacterium]